MKKLLLISALIFGSSAICTLPVYATEATYAASQELPDDARPLTVYKIVQVGGNAWSNNPKSAYYSRSENCIYITEGKRVNQPYTVYENRAYGQTQDGRAEYRYTAGGYYFNL